MRSNKLDWDNLRVFAAVADLGSMTAAAKHVGESTPTVSRKIEELERSLNCQLFIRSTRGVELTEAGKQVLRRTTTIANEANTILSEMSDVDQEAAGDLRIASTDGVLSHWLTRTMPQYLAKNSELELYISILEKDANLLNNEADMSFVFTKPQHRDLHSTRLGVLHYMFFASESYLETYGRPESLFDLQGHRCLLHEAYVNQIDRWATKASDLKKMLKFSIITNSGTVLREVCANGGGITLAPSYACIVDERLIPLELPELVPIEFWLSYTHRVQRLSRGRKFIDWLTTQFDPEANPWFAETFVHPKHWNAHKEKHPAREAS
ncbi:LysR family transcriptional regulator [Henriciella sp. AS95]|uniref:LysR family transcriptional regulator n=1 Tax=Henriciella sp. AS95 TaxID=3135782 RepID=UPI00317563F7